MADTAIGFAVFGAPFQHSRACRPPLRICSSNARQDVYGS